MKLDIRNPRNGQIDYQIEILSDETLSQITQNLRSNQSSWVEMGIDKRVEIMQTWKKSILQFQDELIESLAHDTGRLAESKLEVQLLLNSIDRWCGIAQQYLHQTEIKTASIPFIEIRQDLVPYSLVGVISPWNFPILLSIIDTLPALLAGCAVIVKPSEVTPRFIEPMRKSIEGCPELAKVFQYIAGAGETGAKLIDKVDLVCFTGSVATGQKVYQQASQNFIPAFLELGGKDPAVVLKSADLEQATSSLLWGSVVNAGQSCLSIERIYVEKSIYELFVKRIVEKANALQFAYPKMDGGQIGPIISDKQVKIIEAHLKDAFEKGAKALTGGKIEELGGGSWLFPTILVNVTQDMKVMTEETFGPIVPIMPFEHIEEAIELANSTVFGLSAAVFAGTVEEAIQIGKQIQAGAISINESALTAMVHEGEKNSFKLSGLGGTRMGNSAIKRFMRQKAFLIKNKPAPSPWWFDAQAE